jgi:hypothetical protein
MVSTDVKALTFVRMSKMGEYRQVGDVRNNVKQSPPVVELAFRKEH